LDGVGGQVEYADTEEGDEHAGDDEVDGVEERLAANLEVIRNHGDLMHTVLLLVGDRSGAGYEVPRTTGCVVLQVDLLLTFVPVENDLVAVEGPRAELHLTHLLIEGEVLDVDGAR